MRNRDTGFGQLKASPEPRARARDEILLMKLYQPQTLPHPRGQSCLDRFGCICFVCSALASTGSMLTAANAALENKFLVEEPGSSSAALPYRTQQLDQSR